MLGIFGGSGFYELLDNLKEIEVGTPYGLPSDKFMVGEFCDRKVAFLPRHGRGHKIPPHKIPYRANLWAMKELGVTKIISPCAVGSLHRDIAPGTFVICDSYFDRTRGRTDTFFEGPEVRHMTSVDPYCENLRQTAIKACKKLGVPVVEHGTIVVINGPRFSTITESKLFSTFAGVIGMTAYPEVVLANELGISIANISLATDYDAWSHNEKDIKESSAQEIIETFNKNIDNVKRVIFEIIKNVDMSECPRCEEKMLQSKFN
ncbi:MAG: S-methyl-5'-thioadenosine phosphorylase [Parcubacteria group bacterium CG10_big_fil_rev_8_21_14_0_10_36_14]|nr:MAG: S-methyl-5'-thioadenosine phosphorylase [Parcubacteria group bacterium CG10_big_fil_rev_8_21_14_0_10_36_14]